MHYIICRLICTLLFFFCYYFSPAQQKQKPAVALQRIATSYTYKIIDAASSTFGYDIYSGGRLQIHQPSIPALPGNKGFKTKEAAEKVAQCVIGKMEKGEMPPTVSPDEMKKLKAI